MYKIILLLIISVILSTILTACYDASETDDLSFVIIMGIDKGTKDKLRLTVKVPTFAGQTAGSIGGSGTSGGGSQSGGGQGEYATITVDAPSFFTGNNLFDAFTPRQLNFMHVKLIVFSEEIARSEAMSTYLSAFIRDRQIRDTMHIIISKTSAEEFVKATTPFIGVSLSKTVELFMREPGNTGFCPHTTFNDFYISMKSAYGQAFTILGSINNQKSLKEGEDNPAAGFKNGGEYYAGGLPREGGNNIEFFGTAVFNGGIMAGELNGDETRLLLMVRNEFNKGYWTLRDPKKPQFVVPINIRKAKDTDVRVSFKNDKPIINLKIYLEGDIGAIQSRINYESTELKSIVEEALKQEIKRGMDKLIEKCKALKADVFDFGLSAAMHFGTIEEWEKYNWLKRFEEAQINTEVEFTVKRTGVMLKSSEIISSEGKQ